MGAGKGTAPVAKEFCFEQRFRDGRAVDVNEGLIPTLTVVVDGSRNQFLTGSSGARNQNIAVA